MAQLNSSPKPEAAKDKSQPTPHTFFRNELPLIRRALITLVSSLLFSAALVGGSKALLLDVQETMNQNQSQRNNAHARLQQAESDIQEIHDFQPKFLALRERGFVGDEKRLEWVEQIKQIRENRRLLPLTYEISVQQVFQPDPTVPTGDLELHGSRMKLRMDLLHERDLLDFLGDLQKNWTLSVQSCAVKRTTTTVESPQTPRLSAECTLLWLTLGHPATGIGETPSPGAAQ